MKFGPVPIDQAQGAILAHSLSLPAGRLRKGLVIGPEHIAALREAGHDSVVAARLEGGDLHEDEAASAMAAALTKGAAGLRPSAAFTGRVNLIAEGPGVALIDAAAITAANAVDPAITVATVPPFHQMRRGAMLATVKIIAYGVPGAALEQACAAGRGAITLAAPA